MFGQLSDPPARRVCGDKRKDLNTAHRAAELLQGLRDELISYPADTKGSLIVAGEQRIAELMVLISELASEADHKARTAWHQSEALQHSTGFENLPLEIARHRVFETAEAALFCGFSVPHWRRLYRMRKVPKAIRLSTRKLGWRAGDLIDWLQARLDSS